MRTTLGLLLLTLTAAACGHGIKHRVDDVVLSDVPVDQKAAILAAEAEMNHATEERSKAEADVALDERDISVAQAERSQAKMNRGKAKADLRLAERSQDLNRIEPARAQLESMSGGPRAADAKLAWLRARRDYHSEMIKVAEARKLSAEAKRELEKARLVQATGKRPSGGFRLGDFEQQAARTQRLSDQASAQAEQQRNETNRLERLHAQANAPRLSSR